RAADPSDAGRALRPRRGGAAGPGGHRPGSRLDAGRLVQRPEPADAAAGALRDRGDPAGRLRGDRPGPGRPVAGGAGAGPPDARPPTWSGPGTVPGPGPVRAGARPVLLRPRR